MPPFWALIYLLSAINCDYEISWTQSKDLPYAMIAGFAASITKTDSIYIFGWTNNASTASSILKFDGNGCNMTGKNLCSNKLGGVVPAVADDVIYAQICNDTLYGFNTTSSKFEYNISPIADSVLLSLTSNDTHLFAFWGKSLGRKYNNYALSVSIYNITARLWSKNVSFVSLYSDTSGSSIYYDHNVYFFGCFILI